MKQLLYRFGALMTGICMMIAVFPVLPALAQAEGAPDQAWNETKEMVHAFGLIDLEVGEDEPVSRAEYVMLMARVMNLRERQSGGAYFTDVGPAHKAYGLLNAAVDAGIAAGAGGGLFHPEDAVSLNEAVAMAMRVTGHAAVAEASGGYPWGYQRQGVFREIGSGIADTEALTWKDAFRIAWNLLDIDVLNQQSFGEESEYREVKNMTVYEKYHGIVKFEGVIEAIDHLSCDPQEALKDGTLRIGGTLIQHQYSAPEHYFGRDVRLFARERKDGQEYETVYTEMTKRNTVVTAASDFIDSKTTKQDFYYYAGEEAVQPRRMGISETAAVLYNHQYVGDAYTNLTDSRDFKPEQGFVTLIDHTGDKQADIVLIDAYQNFAVSKSSADCLYLMFGEAALDVSDEERVSIYKNGEKVKPETLAKWDVLNVYAAKTPEGQGINDAERVRIVVGSDKIVGRLEEIRDETVLISGTAYRISDFYRSESGGKETLKLGEEAAYYLNAEQKIVFSSGAGGGTAQYEYIMASHLDTAFGDTLSIRTFGQNGIQVHTCAGRVAVENVPTGSGYRDISCGAGELEGVLRTDSAGAVTDKTVNRLVQIETDSKNTLRKIILPVDAHTEPLGHQDEFSLDDIMKAGENGISSIHYFSGRLNGKYFVPGTAKVFLIPEDKSLEENYQLVSADRIAGSGATQLELYDVTMDNDANVIVMESNMKGKTSVSFTSPWCVVENTYTSTNQEGELVDGVTVYTGGAQVSYTAADMDVEHVEDTYTANTYFKHDGMKLSELRRGDVIQAALDSAGNLESFRLIFRYTPEQDGFVAGSDDYQVADYTLAHIDMLMAYGQLVRPPGDGAFVIQSAGEKVIRPSASRFSVLTYLYEAEKNRVSAASYLDILPTDKVLVNFEWSAEKEIVIFRD